MEKVQGTGFECNAPPTKSHIIKRKKTWEYEWAPRNGRPGLPRPNLRFRCFNLPRTLWQLMLRWTHPWAPPPSPNVETNHVAQSCHVSYSLWAPAVTPQHTVSFPMFSNSFFLLLLAFNHWIIHQMTLLPLFLFL